MAIDAIKQITGQVVPVVGADVDTDRIIPARFLKCVTFDDLAEGLFYDERYDAKGRSKGHTLDAPEYAGATIMLVGPNFGCGSSREHAPQSIVRSGFKVIVGVSFAEIFFGNATNLGMPCVSMSEEDNERLFALVKEKPSQNTMVNLETMKLHFGEETFVLTMPKAAREALVKGQWDSIQELLDQEKLIEKVAESLPYVA